MGFGNGFARDFGIFPATHILGVRLVGGAKSDGDACVWEG